MTISELTSEILSIRPKMLGFAVRLTGNVEDAEDVVSEAVYKSYKNIHSYDERQKFEAWFVTIVRNCFINEYRKKRYRPDIIEIEPYHSIETRETDAALIHSEIVDKVNRIKNGKLLLMWSDGFRYDELAEMFHLPIGTVKSQIFFVRKKLKLVV